MKDGFAKLKGPVRLRVCLGCAVPGDIRLGPFTTWFAKKCARCSAVIEHGMVVQEPAARRSG